MNGTKTKVLLHTTQKNNWKVETTVDAVTSASSVKEVAKFAVEYSAKIKEAASQKSE
jgi:hypothetical protein